METIVCPMIPEDEYEIFLAIIKGGAALPETYDRWLESTTEQNARAVSQGNIVNEVVVHVKDFADYCRSSGQVPTLALLNAFAIYEVISKP